MSLETIKIQVQIPAKLLVDNTEIRLKEIFGPIFGLTFSENKREHYLGVDLEIPYSTEIGYGHNAPIQCMGFITEFFLSVAKGYDYGDSWKKHGFNRSIMSNIDRKYDRLSQASDNNNPSSIVDSSADLGVYSFLTVFDFCRLHHPEIFNRWFSVEMVDCINRYIDNVKTLK